MRLKSRRQAQIARYSFPKTQLFHYFDANNKEELARMVAAKHFLFSFGEKVGFINYCHQSLNLIACRVLRTTLIRIIFYLYKKGKKKI